MNRNGLGWIGAVVVLAAGALVLFVLLQVQTLLHIRQEDTLKQLQGPSTHQEEAVCVEAGKCATRMPE